MLKSWQELTAEKLLSDINWAQSDVDESAKRLAEVQDQHQEYLEKLRFMQNELRRFLAATGYQLPNPPF